MYQSSFLKRYRVKANLRKKFKTDDVALLKFGVDWLKNLLFKQGDPHQQADK